MKNKISIVTISVALMLLVFSGCTKGWLDVNDDPNNTKEATPELVFPAGVMSVTAITGGYFNLVGGFWSQYWTQSNAANQYKYIDQYSIQSGDFNSVWREMYVGGLSDLQYVIDKAEEGEKWEYYLMATVMQAYAYQYMTDLHGDIPYFEALQGDAEEPNFSPKFDTQKAIYTDLLARIDVALSKEIDAANLTTSEISGDVVFDGDLDQWVRFANTLKLKMYIRMAYVDPSTAQAGIAKLYADGVEFLSSDAGINTFTETKGQQNPLFASDRDGLNVATNLRVSTTIYRYYETNSDPRLDLIVQENESPLPQGGFNISSTDIDPTSVCIFTLNATDPVYFISDVESYLLQAEAAARGWGTGSASSLYDMAVLADFTRKGLDGTAFVATSGAYEYPEGTLEENIEAIIMAKWSAFVGTQCTEAFFETNRTGYPKVSSITAWDKSAGTYNTAYEGGELTYSLEGLTGNSFPTRLIYPQDEVNVNANFPGQTSVTDKVWWDAN